MTAQIVIASWGFMAICALGAVSVWLPNFLRRWILLGLSLVAVFLFSQVLASFLCIIIFCLAIYFLAMMKRKSGNWSNIAVSIVVALLWVNLFFIKGSSVFGPINPYFHFPVSVVGISYLTFRAISYFVDVELFEDRSITSYLIYMLFFPAILAGPIERYDTFEEELNQPLPISVDYSACAHRIATGAIMKFVIADNLVPLGIFSIGSDIDSFSTLILWFATLLQLAIIFFDFAGYTAMMIGIAGLCGIRLSENFDKFWKAKNVQEFWQRWHITMTSFIRDYIFTPIMRIGIDKLDRGRIWIFTILANFFTIMLIALWHAPTLGYFWFGIFHGLAITLTQFWNRIVPKVRTRAAAIVLDNTGRVITYVFVSLSMIVWYFNIDQTQGIYARLFLLS